MQRHDAGRTLLFAHWILNRSDNPKKTECWLNNRRLYFPCLAYCSLTTYQNCLPSYELRSTSCTSVELIVVSVCLVADGDRTFDRVATLAALSQAKTQKHNHHSQYNISTNQRTICDRRLLSAGAATRLLLRRSRSLLQPEACRFGRAIVFCYFVFYKRHNWSCFVVNFDP